MGLGCKVEKLVSWALTMPYADTQVLIIIKMRYVSWPIPVQVRQRSSFFFWYRYSLHRSPTCHYFLKNNGQFLTLAYHIKVHHIITCSVIVYWLLFTFDRCCCMASYYERGSVPKYLWFYIRGPITDTDNNFNLKMLRFNNKS